MQIKGKSRLLKNVIMKIDQGIINHNLIMATAPLTSKPLP